jgi:hypothetical protein
MKNIIIMVVERFLLKNKISARNYTFTHILHLNRNPDYFSRNNNETIYCNTSLHGMFKIYTNIHMDHLMG